ncbi:MAG: right-handed parallel beta-helix repeat-containing protein [Phycisphaerales bacterium]
MTRRCAIAVLGLMLGALAAEEASGAEIHVPADHATIGAAMIAAAPGDEIVVAPGTYSNGVQPLISSGLGQGKDLVIRSSGGPEVTILDGLGTIRLVELYQQESNAFVIEGFTLRNGVFATNWGGAMLLWDASPTVRNCIFEFNDAQYGGAVANYQGGNGVFEGCVFRDNTAALGGAINNHFSSPSFFDCVIEDNIATDESLYREGGGAANRVGVMRYERCVIRGNEAQTGGGVHASFDTTIEMIDCVVEGNTTVTSRGGGVSATQGARILAVNTRFLGNRSAQWGGGAYIQSSPQASFVNCEFSGNFNDRYTGAGVYASLDTVIEVRNSTFVNNRAASSTSGGFGAAQNCTVTIANSVFWGNTKLSGTTAEAADEIAQVSVSSPASFTIDHSVVQGLTALTGVGLSGADPLLADPLGVDGIEGTMDDDLRLSSASPAIDAGDNAMAGVDVFDLDGDGDSLESIPFDLSGGARFIDAAATADTGAGGAPVIDLGAYEAASGAPLCPTDLNGDGMTDGADLGLLLGSWNSAGATDLNGDGVTDGADLGLLLGAWGGCV